MKEYLNLSSDQWKFLSLFEAFGEPISIDLIGKLVPLSPSELVDLINKTKESHLLTTVEKNSFSFHASPDSPVYKKMVTLNSKERLLDIIDQMKDLALEESFSPSARANILRRVGRMASAAQIELNSAQQALNSGEPERAITLLQSALSHFDTHLNTYDSATVFLQNALVFSNLSIAFGKYLTDSFKILSKAKIVARQMGDMRSEGQINFHLGRLLYFLSRPREAINAFRLGQKQIQEIGDDDILIQVEEFLGLFCLMQGLLKEAITHFDRAIQVFEKQIQKRILINPLSPQFFGYCAAYLGQFEQAIGSLDFHWRLTRAVGFQMLAPSIRAVLGTILLIMGERDRGSFHLQEALRESKISNNIFSIYHCMGGLGYYYFEEGRIEEAIRHYNAGQSEAADKGIAQQLFSPWTVEIFEKLYRLRKDLENISIPQYFRNITMGSSIHLRGVALRLIASRPGKNILAVERDLIKSESYLLRAGDPIQLAKTRNRLSEHFSQKGEYELARNYAQKASEAIRIQTGNYFLNDLNQRIDENHCYLTKKKVSPIMDFAFFEIITESAPVSALDEFWRTLLVGENRAFFAERGAIFWYEKESPTKLKLCGSLNFSEAELSSPDFKGSMKYIQDAMRQNRPVVKKGRFFTEGMSGIKAVLCLPLIVAGVPRGVIYHDNSYFDACFDSWTEEQLVQLGRYLGAYIDHFQIYYGALEKIRDRMLEASTEVLRLSDDKFIYHSPQIQQILGKVEKVARTDAAVLIQGETGVGKEILARRIHELSDRRSGPFITIDIATIPETLLESELFGHERGAFTGADKSKLGRVELAHRGTLFIDEIGELSRAGQVKLLRLLQDKSFTRVGAHKPIMADFRLIVATNRNLTKEILAENFREDLYFRINTIEVFLPPLRERKGDILPLAHYFLTFFSQKYSRRDLKLSEEDEKRLLNYQWPGNIREIRSVMERAVIVSSEKHLDLSIPHIRDNTLEKMFEDCPTLEEMQRRYISLVLKRAGGRIGGPKGAAKILGLKRSTVYTKMGKLNIKKGL